MLLKIHSYLQEFLRKVDLYMDGIDAEEYKKLQAALFLINALGAGLILYGVLLNHPLIVGMGVIGYIVPSIWDRIQMFLITTDIADE